MLSLGAGLNTHILMANAAVASWTACIKELRHLADTAGAVQDDAIHAFRQRVDKLEQQPPLPKATWKRLVQDAQVTHKDIERRLAGRLTTLSSRGAVTAHTLAPAHACARHKR